MLSGCMLAQKQVSLCTQWSPTPQTAAIKKKEQVELSGLRKLRSMSADQDQASNPAQTNHSLRRRCGRQGLRTTLTSGEPTRSARDGPYTVNAPRNSSRQRPWSSAPPHPAGFVSPMPVGLCTSHTPRGSSRQRPWALHRPHPAGFTSSTPVGFCTVNAHGALHRPHPAGFISPMPVGLCTSHTPRGSSRQRPWALHRPHLPFVC